MLLQLNRIDAQMMRSVTGVQQSEIKLGPVSYNDYQIVLLPLVKSYMRVSICLNKPSYFFFPLVAVFFHVLIDISFLLSPSVSFQAHLELLADKYATEKADAASEAFLVELALDSKKEARGRNEKSKHTQEQSKDKKKNKDTKKLKV